MEILANININLTMISVKEELPNTDDNGLSSDSILFLTEDGKIHFGYYHINNCFYGYTKNGGIDIISQPKDKKRIDDFSFISDTVIYWCYI